MAEKIPPELQTRIAQLQQLQEQLRIVLAQKQSVESELREVERVLSELTKISDNIELYKSIGHILIRTNKEDLVKELTEKKEILELRMRTLEKQESFLQKQFEDLRKKVTEELMRTYRSSS